MADAKRLTKMLAPGAAVRAAVSNKAVQKSVKSGPGLLGAAASNKSVQNHLRKVGTGLVRGAAKTVSQAVKKRIDAGAASKLGGPGDVLMVR